MWNIQVNCTCLSTDQPYCQITCRNVVCSMQLWLWGSLEQMWVSSDLELALLFTAQTKSHCSAECSGVLPEQLVQFGVMAAYGCLSGHVSRFPFPGKKNMQGDGACPCLTWVSLTCCSWDIATVLDPTWNNGSYTLWDKSLSNLPKIVWGSCRKVEL